VTSGGSRHPGGQRGRTRGWVSQPGRTRPGAARRARARHPGAPGQVRSTTISAGSAS